MFLRSGCLAVAVAVAVAVNPATTATALYSCNAFLSIYLSTICYDKLEFATFKSKKKETFT